jgi:hypothetical protein
VIHRALEDGQAAAKSDRRQENQQIAVGSLAGNAPVVVVDIAHARVADPAEEITRTIADFPLPQEDVINFPSAGLHFMPQGGKNALASWIPCDRTIENEYFHILSPVSFSRYLFQNSSIAEFTALGRSMLKWYGQISAGDA